MHLEKHVHLLQVMFWVSWGVGSFPDPVYTFENSLMAPLFWEVCWRQIPESTRWILFIPDSTWIPSDRPLEETKSLPRATQVVFLCLSATST